MSTAPPPTRLTPDDLLAMPNEKDYELVDGQLVERFMGNVASWTSFELAVMLREFVKQSDLGWVLNSEAGYRCFADDPGRVRKPDVSFIRKGRLPGEQLARGYDTIAPDLAVEVVSPRDLVYRLDQKIGEYLQAGVKLVWEINPDSRLATIHRADGSTSRIHEDDLLVGEDVLPGFSCRLGNLFLPPAEAGK
jgi:Uma2 family endonuclease